MIDVNSIENMSAISEIADCDMGKFEGKKKRSSNKKRVDRLAQVESPDNGFSTSTSADVISDTPPDYTYDQLLSFLYHQKRLNSDPSQQESKFKLKPPFIQAFGRKSTLWTNFLAICRHLHRKSAHVSSFVLAELGTSGSTNGNDGNQLLINSYVTLDKMERVLIRYTREFVLCPACKSADTLLQKENTRQGFKVCSTCHVRTPVNLDQNYNKLRW